MSIFNKPIKHRYNGHLIIEDHNNRGEFGIKGKLSPNEFIYVHAKCVDDVFILIDGGEL